MTLRPSPAGGSAGTACCGGGSSGEANTGANPFIAVITIIGASTIGSTRVTKRCRGTEKRTMRRPRPKALIMGIMPHRAARTGRGSSAAWRNSQSAGISIAAAMPTAARRRLHPPRAAAASIPAKIRPSSSQSATSPAYIVEDGSPEEK